jgi:hypothetical protein
MSSKKLEIVRKIMNSKTDEALEENLFLVMAEFTENLLHKESANGIEIVIAVDETIIKMNFEVYDQSTGVVH